MPTLLHLDSSARNNSISRQLSAEFAGAWFAGNPDGSYIHRDLAANPVPHIDGAQVEIMTRLESEGVRDLVTARDAALTPEEKASWDISWPLIEEVLAADVIVIGLPMYNFSVPSAFKAWFDRVAIPPLVVDFESGRGELSGKRVVVVSARGGAYGPDAPRRASDFQEPYLKAAFEMVGLADDLTFLHAELTKSAHVERLSQFRELAAVSLKQAFEGAREAAQREQEAVR
ncbi:FMN-dependent NADH-azoreductase [Streptomyces sp. NPDC050504]|uniref:FMN-dependent NADH-azoreductase n=1 Tax=Streptomyces sp. NPDC050504 TaxID=3365618 RepID=UPI00378D572E